MKTFKEHIAEAYTHGGQPYVDQQWQDQDVMPSAAECLEALNSFVGSMGQHEYMNPALAVKKIHTSLHKLNYHFDLRDADPSGSTSYPLKYGSGTFSAEYDENPLGEFVEEDGISKHIEGGISLMVTVSPVGNGKSMVDAEIVRNSDMGDME